MSEKSCNFAENFEILETMKQIIVVTTCPESDEYALSLAQNFAKGAKKAGSKVERISLYGKSTHEAFEIGKQVASATEDRPQTNVSSADKGLARIDVRIEKMVLVIGLQTLPRRQIVADLRLRQKSRACFINNYLRPTCEQGYIEFAFPNSPHKPEQKYRLTAKGLELYKKLTSKAQ